MDKELEDFLEEVKLRVEVLDGENPVLRIQDALRVAERAGVLYRYAQNGDVWEIRTSPEHSVTYVHKGGLCHYLCSEIIRRVSPRALPAKASEVTPEVEASAPEKKARKRVTK